MEVLTVATHQRSELIDITDRVGLALASLGVQDGVLTLFCPHTTAGLTLNENWDPDVLRDMLLTFETHIAPTDARHRHGEGNSPAHIKASVVGATAQVLVERGALQLGRWQGVFLAEFDGPRQRQVWLKFLGS